MRQADLFSEKEAATKLLNDRTGDLKKQLRDFDRDQWLGLVASLIARLETIEKQLVKGAN